MKPLRILFMIFVCMLLAISGACNDSDKSSSKRSYIQCERTLELDGQKISVAIADSPDERNQGLMHVPYLPENEGMLFIYQDEEPRSFWMKNTLIPLDIAFLDRNLTIITINHMQALDQTPQASGGAAMYALEMNLGWFEKHKVGIGDAIKKIPPIQGGN